MQLPALARQILENLDASLLDASLQVASLDAHVGRAGRPAIADAGLAIAESRRWVANLLDAEPSAGAPPPPPARVANDRG